ncbi:MAG: hypothetical protein K9H18_19705 [Rhodospirillum sp.]|nr:hypothetical protein [Rhodospirillum sp.]MCF8501460.1 hypothetical protein [Rhodospirillum sp.]
MPSIPVVRESGTDLEPGQIRFYEAAKPPLVAGEYKVSAQQTVNGLDDGQTTPQYDLEMPFSVTAPRFTLPAETVQMTYPPANAAGAFDNALANIVLRDKTLPWNRTLDGSIPPEDSVSPPWMAVLTVTAGELGIPDTVQTPAPTVSGTVRDLTAPGTGILGPSLTGLTAADLSQPLIYLDLSADLFTAVAPSSDDLAFLAHVREVNTGNKEILGLKEQGFYSVLVGNRLLRPGAVNYHFLVSLEGFQTSLPPNTIPSSCTKVRLAVLAWWRVTATASIGNFIEIMQALPDTGGVSLPATAFTPFTGGDVCPVSGPTTPTQVAGQALDLGYAPLESTMRIGEHATAWYRGPAAPVPLGKDPLGPYLRSDAAMRYDPATGIYDMSYAVAWEIGRLLALTSNAMAQSLYQWRRSATQSLLSGARQASLHGSLSRTTDAFAKPTQDTAKASRQALADVLGSLDLSGALVGGKVPRRVARNLVSPVAPAPGLLSVEENDRLATDPDPLSSLLAAVLAP